MKENEKKKKTPLIFWLLLGAMVLVIVLLLALNMDRWINKAAPAGGSTVSDSSAAKTPDIDPDATEGKPAGSSAGGTSSAVGIAIPGFKTLNLKAGVREQQVNLRNPEQNQCYFVITLAMADGTVIYQSKMIPPGKGVYDILLTEPLEAGTYQNCLLKYQPYKMDAQLTPDNGAQMDITIQVSP